MNITIQGIPERGKSIKRIIQQLKDQKNPYPVTLHLDKHRISCFSAFKDMLQQYPTNQYRLHLQDDVVLSKELVSRLPKIAEDMEEQGYDLVSLFVPNRAKFVADYDKGIQYANFPNFLWLQAVIFSPKLQGILKEESDTYTGKDDDVFVQDMLKKYKLKAYAHLPSLIQHDVGIASSLGHANNSNRQSKLFLDEEE